MTEWHRQRAAGQLTPQLPKNCCAAILFRLGPEPDILRGALQTASSKHGNIDQMARDERRYTKIVLYAGPP